MCDVGTARLACLDVDLMVLSVGEEYFGWRFDPASTFDSEDTGVEWATWRYHTYELHVHQVLLDSINNVYKSL